MTRTLANPSAWLMAALGSVVGLASLRIAEMPDRWVAAVLAGAGAALAVLASGHLRRAALFTFVLSLQLGLALYLTPPRPTPGVGASWPSSLTVPLATITAIGALAAALPRRWTWGGVLFPVWLLLGLTTALSIPGSPVRLASFSHLVLTAAYFVVLLASANLVRDAGDYGVVVRGLMLSLVSQSVIYFVQYVLGGTFTLTGERFAPVDEFGRYGGTAGPRPAAFASFLLPLLLIALAHFVTSRETRIWRRVGLPAAAGCAALLLTFTRASWAGFALGLFYLVAAGRRRRILVRRRVLVLLTALGIVGILFAPRILRRVTDNHRAAFDERWVLIQMAARVIEAHPWTGVGAGAYPYVFRDYLTPELADRWLYVVHNVYVLRAAETGLPGLAALLLFLAAAFRQAAPERMFDVQSYRTALGWRAGLIALSWEMLWDVSLGPSANSLMWFLCGLMAAGARIPRGRRAAPWDAC